MENIISNDNNNTYAHLAPLTTSNANIDLMEKVPSAILPNSIRTLPLLSGLSEHDKSQLLKDSQIISCARGEHLFLNGDQITHFYIIISGTMKLYRETADGHEKTIHILKDGSTICESEIMDSFCQSHRVNCMAVSHAVLMEFPMNWLKNAASKHAVIALNLLSSISQQAHLAETEAEQQAYLPAAELLACFLQQLCIIDNFDPNGFDLPYSKTLIASRLGMELETLSRALPKLKEYGITIEGKHVIISDFPHISNSSFNDSKRIKSAC